jgi:hypothetical protein
MANSQEPIKAENVKETNSPRIRTPHSCCVVVVRAANERGRQQQWQKSADQTSGDRQPQKLDNQQHKLNQTGAESGGALGDRTGREPERGQMQQQGAQQFQQKTNTQKQGEYQNNEHSKRTAQY